MKSSLALVTEQLLLLDPFCELPFEIVFSFGTLSLFPLLLSASFGGAVTADVPLVNVVESVVVIGSGGEEFCLGVSNALNGASGIIKSSSLTTICLFSTKAPTFIVSLSDFEISSLQKKKKDNKKVI